jgi:peptidoglycan/xylan/chitin deacetylase (PgdA/CDA1 family)
MDVLRKLVKTTAEAVLIGAGAGRIGRARFRTRTLVLAYHNIVPSGAAVRGDRSLHLAEDDFARQLDALRRTHQVVPLTALLEPHDGRRPRVVITLDDAYHGAVTAGVAALARRGLPATIFVAPGLLDGATFWWDECADPVLGLAPDIRARALDELQGAGTRVRAALGGTAAELPPHQGAASQAELEAAASVPGITLGSHTWSHPNLSTLGAGELRDELGPSLTWLREEFPDATVPWLSYPYGIHSAEVERAAAEAGYVGALRIDGGWLPKRSSGEADRFVVPRLNVPAGISLRGFRLRVEGVRP